MAQTFVAVPEIVAGALLDAGVVDRLGECVVGALLGTVPG